MKKLNKNRLSREIRGFANLIINRRERWEQMYREEQWEFLNSPEQKARHYLISRWIQERYPQGARVLDIGCGEAVLFTIIKDHLKSYTGIDIAETATVRCREKYGRDPRCRFETCAFESYDSDERFDAIVFNEVLYYFPLFSAVPQLERAFRLLHGDSGCVIVSLNKNPKARLVGLLLDRRFSPVQSIRIENGLVGSAWTVSLYSNTKPPMR